VPSLRNPMLLADYLTQSYRVGGVVAVLALESLFHLIMHHNLDYPDFFRSLYRLCTVEVFSARYRVTFMKLLNASLKSVNIPAYVAAAFAKRLAHLALHTPSPNAPFCIAQCTWLLRQHPQTQPLIHRSKHTKGEFNNCEEEDLEKVNMY
jgi:U3 small nucleolar RNA-associated protein 19